MGRTNVLRRAVSVGFSTAAIVACASRPDVQRKPAAPTAMANPVLPPSADAGAPLPDLCPAIVEQDRAVRAKSPGIEACGGAATIDLTKDAPCISSAGGTWSLARASATYTVGDSPSVKDGEPKSCDLDVQKLLVFHAPDGSESSETAHEDATACGWHETSLQGTFDFDGDGRPEAIVVASEQFTCEGDEETVQPRIVTASRDGKIAPYAPAQHMEYQAVRDVDKDGRPDLVDVLLYRALKKNGCANEDDSTYVKGLGHSVPDGTFAVDDAVARAQMRAACGDPSKKLVVKNKTRNDEETGANVACARMGGRSASDVESELRRACSRFAPAGDAPACTKDPTAVPLGDPCPTWWLEWARKEPPVHLAGKPPPPTPTP